MTWMTSPLKFAQLFNETVSKRAGDIQDNWFNAPEYTRLLLNPGGLLDEVRDGLGLDHWGAEFLRLDAAYSTKYTPGEEFRLALVVEHENAVRTAEWEVRKLAHVACPLRVLITYAPDVFENPSHLSEYCKTRLARYCQLIEAIGVFASGQLLVVFGAQDKPPISNRATSVAWRYYLYAGSEFLPIYPRENP